MERKFEISTLMNFHETLEIKCNFQRPSSSDSPLKMITVLQLVVLAFPTGRDSANFRDKGTEVLSLSQDKGTMGQAKYLANGRDEVQNGTKQKRTFQNRKWMSQNKKGHSKTGKDVPNIFENFKFILSKDRGVCPGTFAPALVPGQRYTLTIKPVTRCSPMALCTAGYIPQAKLLASSVQPLVKQTS